MRLLYSLKIFLQETITTANSFQHHSNITNGRYIDLLKGILTVKANGRVCILTDKSVLPQNVLGQPRVGPHGIHIDTYITDTIYVVHVYHKCNTHDHLLDTIEHINICHY